MVGLAAVVRVVREATASTVGWPRRHGVTRSGAFLDPLADKILVLGAMFSLVREGVFWFLPVVIIAVREVLISLYRTVVGARGSVCRHASSESSRH